MFIIGDSKYSLTNASSEEELEEVLINLDKENNIFQDFVIVDCKMQGRLGKHSTLNDLILVSKTCEQWFIIEVEVKNSDGYANGHIHEQLALQSQASWSRIIPNIREKLIIEHNFSADIVSQLGDNDPGFILIIPESTERINQICQLFDVIVIETQLWKNKFGESAIFLPNPELIPDIWNKEEIYPKYERVFGLYINFYFDSQIRKKIRVSEKCFMYIDNKQLEVKLGLTEQIQVEITDEKGSDTYDLAFLKKINAKFTMDYDDQHVYLHFEREARLRN
jgi:hypothetical protein